LKKEGILFSIRAALFYSKILFMIVAMPRFRKRGIA